MSVSSVITILLVEDEDFDVGRVKNTIAAVLRSATYRRCRVQRCCGA